MLRLTLDQDFNQRILRGRRQRIPNLDAITDMMSDSSVASDPELLKWAAGDERIILTHNRRTMPDHAIERIISGEKMSGLIVVPRRLPIIEAINDLEIIAVCSSADEWDDSIRFLPL